MILVMSRSAFIYSVLNFFLRVAADNKVKLKLEVFDFVRHFLARAVYDLQKAFLYLLFPVKACPCLLFFVFSHHATS